MNLIPDFLFSKPFYSDLLNADVLNIEPAPGLSWENDDLLSSDLVVLGKRGMTENVFQA